MSDVAMRIAGDDSRGMTRRFNFTMKSLEGVKASGDKGRAWVYDTHIRNLAYMVTSTGARSFYVIYKFEGLPYRYRLGDETLSIDQARKLAREAMVKVANGINPQAEKRSVRSEITFGQLFGLYMEKHAKVHNRTWREDQQKYDLHLKPWAIKKFKNITRQDVADLHTKIGAGEDGSPGAANRTLSLISSMFNRAGALANYNGPNPATGIRRFPEHKRERFLSGDELSRFAKALKAEGPEWVDFFTLLLYTGVRVGNMKAAEWTEFDLKAKTWTIAAAKFKTNKPMTVALADEAVAILKRRLRDCEKDETGNPVSPYVFSARGVTGRLVEYRKCFERIKATAKLSNLRTHDLRRTLGSWQAAAGASLPIIGKSLGHTQQSTTAIYARLNIDPVRASVSTAVAAMVKASTPKRKPRPKK